MRCPACLNHCFDTDTECPSCRKPLVKPAVPRARSSVWVFAPVFAAIGAGVVTVALLAGQTKIDLGQASVVGLGGGVGGVVGTLVGLAFDWAFRKRQPAEVPAAEPVYTFGPRSR